MSQASVGVLILTLVALCGGLSLALARVAHIDPMTAYLAMSRGGIDAVAIIVASAKLDMSFHASVVDLAVPGENDPAID